MTVPNPFVMFRYLIRCCLVLICLTLTNTVSAQWQIVSKPSNERLGVINFLNEFTGFVGFRVPNGQVIAKTTDAGVTWHMVTLEFSSYSGDVSDIQMVDALNGWATCDATDASLTNRGLYRTTDGGMTWRSVQVITDATSVLQIGQSVFLTSRRVVPLVPLTRSTDGGATWRASVPTLLNDVAFVDPMRGVASRFERASGTAGDWFRTVDGGNTWIAIPNMDESWSVYGEWGTPNFYAVPEDEPSAQNAITGTPVIRSTDYGQTWAMLSRLNFHSTGHLAVASGNFYFQVSERNPQNRARASAGIYRSINRGTSWTPVGGPSSDPDTRFSATGCKGGIVYASDMSGNLWKTRTGGDGAITEPPFTLEFGSDTIRIASMLCENKTTRFSFRNLYCSPDSVVSIELDQTAPATTTGALSLIGLPVLPKIYKTDEGDQFDVRWDPSKLITGDTTIHVRIRLRYYSTATKTLIDTSIVVEARAQGAAPTADIANTLNMGELPSCSPSDSLFTITNTGCDTMYVMQPTFSAGSGLTLLDKNGNAPTYPLVIPPGGTDSIRVVVNSTVPGPFNINVTLPATHQKIAANFNISIRGMIVVTDAQFSVAFDSLAILLDSLLLDRGTMTRCDPPQEFYLYVRNPGCTEVALRNVMFEGDGSVFDVVSESVLPDTLSGLDVQRIKITIKPGGTLGTRSDRLRVRYKVGDDPSIDLYYTFSLNVEYGTRLLSIVEAKRDLDTIEYCQTRDTVIRFQNVGCDTLTITEASLIGADYDFVNAGAVPRKIAPGAYDSVTVQYDPRLPGDALGSLQITSDADTLATRSIDLVAFALPTDTVTFRLVAEREVINDNDTLNFDIIPDTTIRGKGLRALSMILSYNGDVLTFMSATAKLPGLTVLPPVELQTGPKARQIVLTLLHANEITLDSLMSLVSLRFRTTLSDSTHATMRMSDFTLNGGDPLFAKCALGSRADEAKLVLTMFCGDSLIKKTLLEGKLVLSTIRPWPNPSSLSRGAAVKLSYVLNEATSMSVKVYSLEGVLVYERSEEREMGEGMLEIPGERLHNGTFFYSLEAGASIIRGQFTVVQ